MTFVYTCILSPNNAHLNKVSYLYKITRKIVEGIPTTCTIAQEIFSVKKFSAITSNDELNHQNIFLDQ